MTLTTPALPGRTGRAVEELVHDPVTAVARVLSEIRATVDGPYHLFGHSLGGQLGYHVARHAVAVGAPAPVSLQISSARARPGTAFPSGHLTDAALVEMVRALGSVPEVALASAGWRRAAFPVLRSDLRLSLGLAELEVTPLDLPVTVRGGTDDPLVPLDELAAWSSVGPQVRLETHPGGHFYLEDDPRGIAHDVLRTVIAAEA